MDHERSVIRDISSWALGDDGFLNYTSSVSSSPSYGVDAFNVEYTRRVKEMIVLEVILISSYRLLSKGGLPVERELKELESVVARSKSSSISISWSGRRDMVAAHAFIDGEIDGLDDIRERIYLDHLDRICTYLQQLRVEPYKDYITNMLNHVFE